MNFALLLFGIHYQTNYKHFSNNTYNIDFRYYTKNIKTKLLDYFNEKYSIDTFICTNHSEILNELLDFYKPKSYYIDNNDHLLYSRNFKFLRVIQLLIQYMEINKKSYNLICITRFDIYFLKDFLNIDLKKLNLVSILEHPNVCDDNLYLFPIEFLYKFYELVNIQIFYNKKNPLILHQTIHKFTELFPINYLCNEYVQVSELSFYKLRFFNKIEFIINKYLFADNIIYNSMNDDATIMIKKEIIFFTKKHSLNCQFAWFGYEILNCGLYNISFDILSDKNIINFDFIKLHNPIQYVKVNNIIANVPININFIIDIVNKNDLLIFIFDYFNDIINMQYKNIKITLI